MLPSGVSAAAQTVTSPVILFPAYHLTKLKVDVRRQTVAPECPASGSFEFWAFGPESSFSQACQDKLLTLRYNPNPALPMPWRFTEQPAVSVRILDYGKPQSAPAYEALYGKLESVGYVRDKDIKVAGYDARLTPDLGGFLARTKRLVERTYAENGNRPVHLVGHSNGPIYAQYLLTNTSRAWKAKYVHGFTALAGNFPGQGSAYSFLFSGLNIADFSYPATKEAAAISARRYLTTPSTYLSAADPAVFGDREVVIQDTSTGRSYTPRDYRQLFADAHLRVAKEIGSYYLGFVKFADTRSFPYVDVYAEKGSGMPTIVGARLPNLVAGQVFPVDQVLTRDGDGNQEDITNDAVLAWRAMPCHHFSLTDNPGVDHFSLASNAGVLDRLVAALQRPRNACG